MSEKKKTTPLYTVLVLLIYADHAEKRNQNFYIYMHVLPLVAWCWEYIPTD